MSNDLISRQAAIDVIDRLILPQTKGETASEEINRVAWRCALNCAEEMIIHLPSAQPTIDAVEVVRCRECKHSKDGVGGRIKCAYHNWWQEPDFFCADAERRDPCSSQDS